MYMRIFHLGMGVMLRNGRDETNDTEVQLY
jgi:hypothetical protein